MVNKKMLTPLDEIPKANNLLLLRYLFAFSILLNHFFALNGSDYSGPLSSYWVVEGFFLISGFLVFRSYSQHPSPKQFLLRRFYRLIPGYVCVVAFGVLVGLLMTTLSWRQYFAHPDTWRYMAANFLTLNFVQPTLPGVFEQNLMGAVNGALWTVKVEILLYLTVPLFYACCRRFSFGRVFIFVYVGSFLYSEGMLYLFDVTGNALYDILHRQGFGQLNFFYGGAVASIYFKHFSRYRYFLLAGALFILLLPDSFIFRFLFPIALVTVVIWAAYFIRHISFCDRWENISYGIYLYHFPIIQAMIACGLATSHEWLALGLTFVGSIVCAYLSWYGVERYFYQSKISTHSLA